MLINAFKNRLFPLASGNYDDEYKLSESEESSESEDEKEPPRDDRLPTIEQLNKETLEEISKLDKFYGRDLVY